MANPRPRARSRFYHTIIVTVGVMALFAAVVVTQDRDIYYDGPGAELLFGMGFAWLVGVLFSRGELECRLRNGLLTSLFSIFPTIVLVGFLLSEPLGLGEPISQFSMLFCAGAPFFGLSYLCLRRLEKQPEFFVLRQSDPGNTQVTIDQATQSDQNEVKVQA